jgi:hypothetical protein
MEPKPPAPRTPEFWMNMAKLAAQDAYENHFESRWGVYYVEGEGVVCLYNNNPYKAGKHLREEETQRFRAKLRERGLKELAYATTDDGYSYAMLIQGYLSDQVWATATMKVIGKETLDKIRRDKPTHKKPG